MSKKIIKGLNGSLELNKKYIYLILYNGEKPTEEHIIWFDEIEDIIYKKPTSYKYGYIAFYLSTRSFVTNRKKVYKIILDRINEKDLETNKYIYTFIKEIVDNKKVKVLEVIENSDEKQEKEELTEEKKDAIKEIRELIKENNERLEKNQETKPKEEKGPIVLNTVIKTEKQEEPVNKTIDIKPKENTKVEVIEKEEIIKPKEENVELPKIKKTTPKKEESYEESKKIEVQEEVPYIEVNTDLIDNYESIDEEIKEEEQKEKPIKSIDKLEEKIYRLEKELQKITYKEIILNDYLNNAYDRKKIDKLVIELKKLIEKIEKIKKEILKQEKLINEDDFVKLDNGNVTVLSMNKSLIDENELNSYINQYKDVVRKLERVQKDTDELKESTEEKKKEINMSDEEYDRLINQFKGVKSNKEFISGLIKETKEDLSKVKWRIERTIEPRVKYKFVWNAISNRTKALAAMTALNELRPKRSRLSMMALSLFTGVSSIEDILGFDIKRVEYNEIVQREFLEGLDYIDTDKTRALIEQSKEEIDRILSDCERKYGNYPGFKSLKKNLESLRKDIDEQDKELRVLEERVHEYNVGSKMKTLRHAE